MTMYAAPSRWPVRSLRVDLSLAFALYVALGWVAIVLARMPGTIAVIWLANGVTMALIVSAPRERTLVLLAAAGAGNFTANALYGDPLWLSLAFVPPNMVEIAAGVALFRRFGRQERFADDPPAFLAMLGCTTLMPQLLGATLGAATLHALGFAAFSRVWLDWYVGDMLGALATVPLALALRSVDRDAALRRLASVGSLVALAAVVAATVAAAHLLPDPFVAIGVALFVVAILRSRVETFAGAMLAVCALATLLSVGVLKADKTPLAHGLLFLSAFLALLPAQLLAVVMARQRALSQTLAAVGSQVDEIVTFTDLDGALRWVNQAREIYWGVPNSTVIGKVPEQTLPHEFREGVFKPMYALAIQGQTVRRREQMHYPGRGLRLMDMSMQPARDEDGNLIGALFCASDITELEDARLKQARTADALRTSNERLEQFVRISSHDLREPLNTITQFCGLIEQHHAACLDASGALYFRQVREGAARMKQMLDDVLQYVRLDQDAPQAMELVDLDLVLTDVRQSLDARIRERGAELVIESLGSVLGHRALLTLLVQNLVANALKFVPAGVTPVVRVSAHRDGSTLRLRIEDNGIGIETGRIEELGVPFRRLHARRKYEGTGLGLSICKRIAEQHAGAVEIQSVPGKGSTFTLAVPSG